MPVERDVDDAVAVARVVERVAALVRAGIDARRAWAVVASRSPGLEAVTVAAAAGTPIADALAERPGNPMGAGLGEVWDDVARTCRVAERTGAPVALTLDALAVALRDRAAIGRSVESALAGPRASGRVVLALPGVGVLFGLLWGGESLRFLFATVPGWACVLGAVVLVAAARVWTARLVSMASPSGGVPGLELELWAVALSGGSSRSAAERVVLDALGDRQGAVEERRVAAETLDLADAVGIPAASLLRSAADDLRRDEAAAGLAAAERLGVGLVLPLGICLLPAFVLVGIVPVVAGLLSSTVRGFG